jgi:hypothetical protein
MIKIKKYISNLDKKFLKSFLNKFYYKIYIFFKFPKITPLSKETQNYFPLNERYKFFQSANDYLRKNRINGIYLEFGCHGVHTFRMALNTLGKHTNPFSINKFYAFDSFEGMPEPLGIDIQKMWKKSVNFTSLENFKEICKKDLYRIEIIKGFFSESLKNFFFPKESKIAMCYIDCDYYSSTKNVFEFLKKYLNHGMILVLDDWDCYYSDPLRGQQKAFAEFKKELIEKFSFSDYKILGSGGRSFICHDLSKIGKEIV